MDFSFTEEQTLLRNSVSKFLADNYNFETFDEDLAQRAGLEPRELEAIRGTGPAGRAVAGRLWRAWRRPGRRHDHHGRVRQRAGGRAVCADRRRRRRISRMRGGSEAQKEEWLRQDRGRRNHHRVRLRRTARAATISPISRRPRRSRAQLCPERPEGRGARRALGRHADRHRAHGRRPAR